MNSVFNSSGYRDFLRDCFPTKGKNRGRRQDLAAHLNCQTSFLSLVLTERAHMSEEMFIAACDHLRLSTAELEFGIYLFHRDRAGTDRLRSFYEQKLERMRARYTQVEGALNDKQLLKLEEQIPYYSSWLHAAIHVATTLNHDVTLEFLSNLLKVDLDEVVSAASFLIEAGIVGKVGDRLTPGSKRVHLSRNSPLAIGSHVQWRLEACRQIRKKNESNLHFSSTYSLSKKDYRKIKDILQMQILEIESVVAPSKEEQMCGLVIDLFGYEAMVV